MSFDNIYKWTGVLFFGICCAFYVYQIKQAKQRFVNRIETETVESLIKENNRLIKHLDSTIKVKKE